MIPLTLSKVLFWLVAAVVWSNDYGGEQASFGYGFLSEHRRVNCKSDPEAGFVCSMTFKCVEILHLNRNSDHLPTRISLNEILSFNENGIHARFFTRPKIPMTVIFDELAGGYSCPRVQTALGGNSNPDSGKHLMRCGNTAVLKLEREIVASNEGVCIGRIRPRCYDERTVRDVCPHLPLGVSLLLFNRAPCGQYSSFCRLGGSPVEVKAVDQRSSSEERQDCLSYSDLIGPIRSLGRELLRNKIIYFTLGSFALLPFGALGLFWFFEYSDRKTRQRGAFLALLLPVAFGLLLYGLVW